MLSLALVLVARAGLGETGERCAPATAVEGDETLAADVTRELAARGIAAVPARGCAAVRAQVTRDDDSVIVEIVDAEGRRVARRVSTAATAAAVIESWTRTELTEGLLERREGEPPEPRPDAATIPAGHKLAIVGAAYESSLGSDGSIWNGANLSGCVSLGPLCAGVVLRFALDSGWSGDTGRIGGNRMATDMMLALEIPARSRRLVVAPGVAAGFGWMRSSNQELGESERERHGIDRSGARAEAHLRVATPLAGGVWITFIAAASYSPSAAGDVTAADGSLLPSEPRGFARLAIGISSSEWP